MSTITPRTTESEVRDGDIVDQAKIAVDVITPLHPDPDKHERGVRLRLGVNKRGKHMYYEKGSGEGPNSWHPYFQRPFSELDWARINKLEAARVVGHQGPSNSTLLYWIE